MDSDKISLMLKDSPDLADAFIGASAGDKITLTLTFMIDEAATDLLTGSIDPKSITGVTRTDGDDDETDEDSEDGEPDDSSAPVVSVMGSGYKK